MYHFYLNIFYFRSWVWPILLGCKQYKQQTSFCMNLISAYRIIPWNAMWVIQFPVQSLWTPLRHLKSTHKLASKRFIFTFFLWIFLVFQIAVTTMEIFTYQINTFFWIIICTFLVSFAVYSHLARKWLIISLYPKSS